jgi:hypothetical protein
MYRKHKTLTIPNIDGEYIVPLEWLPDDVLISFTLDGEEVGAYRTADGVVLDIDGTDDVQVGMHYDWQDTPQIDTTPVAQAVERMQAQQTPLDLTPLLEAVQNIRTTVDMTPVVQELARLRSEMKRPQATDTVDYSEYFMRLETLLDILARKDSGTDMSEVLALLREMKDTNGKGIQDMLVNGRLPVSVDRIGGANTGHLLSESTYQNKQDQLITAISSIGGTTVAKTTLYARDAEDMLLYKGTNATEDASESATDWTITKYTRDVDGNLESKDVKTGSWSSKEGLFV